MSRFSKTGVPDCRTCRFKPSCFYDHLDPAAQKAWNKVRSAAEFSADQTVYSEGEMPEGIYVICKGRVKIFTTDSRGQQLITWIRHPGELFGHIALFSQCEYRCSGKSMGHTVLSLIDSKSLSAFLDAHPGTYPLLLRTIATELRMVQDRLKDTAYQPAKSKVAATLIRAISYKSKGTASPAIHGLKRTEIAEITGLALETVVRALAELEKSRVIKREAKAIKILDYPVLSRLAGFHPSK
ncbi:MAG TPA: Crp/Fnr family transcriptional regulator [Elusimicrobiales bacterium]|nr:Crp/Fnr family transcriptional regulator [Elusimicrobiales bacterium]